MVRSLSLKVFWFPNLSTPLPTSMEALQNVNKLLSDFLWDGKGDKIKSMLITKVSWIKKYLDPTNRGNWNFFSMKVKKKHGGDAIFSCNLHKNDIPMLGITSPFVREVLETWAELHFSNVAAITDANIGDQIIWYNFLIRINDRLVFSLVEPRY